MAIRSKGFGEVFLLVLQKKRERQRSPCLLSIRGQIQEGVAISAFLWM